MAGGFLYTIIVCESVEIAHHREIPVKYGNRRQFLRTAAQRKAGRRLPGQTERRESGFPPTSSQRSFPHSGAECRESTHGGFEE